MTREEKAAEVERLRRFAIALLRIIVQRGLDPRATLADLEVGEVGVVDWIGEQVEKGGA